MNAKTFFLRFAGLAVIAAVGWLILAPLIHLMIMLGLTGNEPDGSFGEILLQRTAFVWMGSVVVGLAGVFIRDSWRYVFYLCPLYAPPLFMIFQILMK